MSDDMRQFYDDEAQRQKWGRDLVGAGLFSCEAGMVDTYFQPGASVLDVGCGGGREALALAERGFQVTAVDYTPAFVEACTAAAKERGLTIDVRQANADSLPFADEQFDHVIMVGQLLGHVRPQARRRQVLREIGRVMKPGVAIVSTNAIERSPMYGAYFLVANFVRRFYNPHELEENDAFVRHVGESARLMKPRPVFHWYHADEFRLDAAAADWQVEKILRRWEEERDPTDRSTSGETFYAIRKG